MKKLVESWLKIRYTLYSPFYNIFIGERFMNQRARSVELAEAKPDDNILIVGAGTGLDLEFLKNNTQITVVDISTGMLRKLQRRAKRLGVAVNVKMMDARKLDFPDLSFDIIFLHMIVAVIPEYQKCLNEVSRVLKPDGKALVFDKFLPGSKPSLFRKIINPFSILIASDLNMKVDDLKIAGLKIDYQERTGLLGLFRIVRLKK